MQAAGAGRLVPAASSGNPIAGGAENGFRRGRHRERFRWVGCGLTAGGAEEEGADPGAGDVVDHAGEAGETAAAGAGQAANAGLAGGEQAAGTVLATARQQRR